ncbi:MAG: phosphoglycerate dehydrogenase [Gammaproteobacteria bacterium]|nr:phosphoglycerate dehydrogenase [Gammaproteobacteria bacterium]
MRVLVTCPPMLGMMDEFLPAFTARGIDVDFADVIQVLSEEELLRMIPAYDGWIIGDDPATAGVFEAGRAGRLKAAVKWGAGIDNVAVDAARRLGVAVAHTPGMFGREVADIAMGYLTAIARGTFQIDRAVRDGRWPKPRGISLKGKKVGLVGYGDVGRNTARRLLAAEMTVLVYDPAAHGADMPPGVELGAWPERLSELDFLVFTCSLNEGNVHMFNRKLMERCKHGVRVVNVSRGRLIDERALAETLQSGRVHSAALDVMEREPLPVDSPLRRIENCIFGSHNASNTTEAVRAASEKAMNELFRMLGAA